MKIALSLLAVSFVSVFGQSKPASNSQKAQTEPKYVITQHTVVPSKDSLPPEDLYIIEYGSTVLNVKYAESQTSTAKPGDSLESGLHVHLAYRNPDVSQVPSVGVPIRACTFNTDRDHDGDLVIAHQLTDEPCMARVGDRLLYEPSPNGPVLFTYVAFDILSEKMKSNR